MWKELEGNYYLLPASLCLWTLLDEYDHCCNSETREDSLRGYPECEGIHGGRMSRLRIRILYSSLSLHHLAAQEEAAETTQDPGKSGVQLGGRGVRKAEGGAVGERLGWSLLVIPMAHLKQSMLEALLVPLTFIPASYVHIFVSILRICSSQGRLQYFSTSTSHITVVTMFYGPAMIMYMRPRSWYDLERVKKQPFSTMLSLPSSTPSSTVSRRIM